MAGVLLAGVRFSIRRRNAYARHQHANVLTPDCESLPIQLVAQHARGHATQPYQISRAD